jgi:hypothetical protein
VKDVDDKKGGRLEKNKVTPEDIPKMTEATSTSKSNSKRKPRISDQAEKIEALKMPKVGTTGMPELKASRPEEIETEEVSEIRTDEVQQTSSKIQEKATKKIEGEETLELIDMIDQDLDIHSEAFLAFLEADPLYREYKAAQLPKYQRLDVKLYVLLRDDQLEFLARLTRQIMKNRTSAYKIERITKNTIIRALIDNLKELELDVHNIPDETELTKRVADSIRSAGLASLSGEQGA